MFQTYCAVRHKKSFRSTKVQGEIFCYHMAIRQFHDNIHLHYIGNYKLMFNKLGNVCAVSSNSILKLRELIVGQVKSLGKNMCTGSTHCSP